PLPAGSDSIAAAASLTFAPGETSKTISVTLQSDTTFEPDEALSVLLSNPSRATILADTATGTILNDDPTPTISIDSISAQEGNSGTTPFVFTVTLSNPSSQTITVDFATGGGSATAGTDYDSTTTTLTFSPGQTSMPITVLVNGDSTDEFDETFSVVLTNPANATIASGIGTGTILNDDPPPSLSINSIAQSEGDSGT